MIDYVKTGFIVTLLLSDDATLVNCYILAADSVGLAVRDTEGDTRLVPWASVTHCLLVDEA